MDARERPYAGAFREISAKYFQDFMPVALEEYSLSDKTFDDQIKVAKAVQAAVSERLRLSSIKTRPEELLSPEQIRSNEKTNCYGNAIVTSELLEELGVDHQVAFANQHAFLMLSEQSSGRVFMLDSLRTLRLELTGKEIISKLPPAEWQLGCGPLVHNTTLNASKLVMAIPNTRDRAAAEMNPWLGMNMTSKDFFRNNYQDDIILPVRVYPSLPGREILEKYYHSVIYTNRKEVAPLVELLEDMAYTYPDTDPANKLKLARGALLAVGQHGSTVDIRRSAAAVYTYSHNNDSKILAADALRRVGAERADASLVRGAINLYKTAAGTLAQNKIAAARRELRKITGDSTVK